MVQLVEQKLLRLVLKRSQQIMVSRQALPEVQDQL